MGPIVDMCEGAEAELDTGCKSRRRSFVRHEGHVLVGDGVLILHATACSTVQANANIPFYTFCVTSL